MFKNLKKSKGIFLNISYYWLINNVKIYLYNFFKDRLFNLNTNKLNKFLNSLIKFFFNNKKVLFNKKKNKEITPSLSIYRINVASFFSILNRVLGILIFLNYLISVIILSFNLYFFIDFLEIYWILIYINIFLIITHILIISIKINVPTFLFFEKIWFGYLSLSFIVFIFLFFIFITIKMCFFFIIFTKFFYLIYLIFFLLNILYRI